MSTHTPTKADAETTIRFAILDGLAQAFGGSHDEHVDAIYKSLMAPHLRWALDAASGNSRDALVAALRAAREELYDLGGFDASAFEHGDRVTQRQSERRRDEIYAQIDAALAGE